MAVCGILGVWMVCAGAMAQPKAAPAGDEASLLALEQKWDTANLKGDVAALTAILADSFVTTNSDGKTNTKSDVLAKVRNGEVKFHAAEASEMKVQIYGDAAVITGIWTGKFTEKGKTEEAKERFTDTFIRQNGQWKIVASHASILK